jgi:type VI secretion system protein VasG
LAITREAASGTDHSERQAALTADQVQAQAELEALTAQWKQEKELVTKIQDLRLRAEAASLNLLGDAAPEPAETPAELKQQLAAATSELRALQGEEPLVHPVVDGQAVAEVVATWTGIPVGRMVADEINTVLALQQKLMERVVGQDHALDAIAQSIRTSRAGLTDPRKPIGVFMMAGTSGVGKTETALAVAELLYGGEQNLTVINMSEFKEEHKVSLLMGSPPGYVGYGEGGVLTEAVRRRPYSVVLLDEMEKAHPGVQDVFYQVFDKGQMKDGEGRDIDFRNCVIIMTSNAGTDTISRLCADPELTPEPGQLREALQPDLLKVFKPAFLGRCNVVIYYPLRDEILQSICMLKLRSIGKRVQSSYGTPLTFDDTVPQAVVARCKEVESGARAIDNILSRSLLPELSALLLTRIASGAKIEKVHVGIDATNGEFQYDLG